nr:DUF1329 domain-containing protein [Ralstonia sp. A12]
MRPTPRLRIPAMLLAGSLALASAAFAADSADELKQLDGKLTPVGAERAGSKDGEIPAWSGKWLGTPPGVTWQAGERYPDPYASEKPVAVITAQNMAQYESHLTDGQKALLKRYPDTFKIPVYPSHRDFRFTDAVYKNIRTMAPSSTTTAQAANGIKNAPPVVPFPIPKNGVELMWNLRLSSGIGSESATYDQAVVYPEGNIAWGRVRYDIFSLRNTPSTDPKSELYDRTFFRQTTMLPLRDRGTVLVGYSLWDDNSDNANRTWMYNPGTRRVRQAPEYGFDQPNGAGGFRTVDDDRLYNGTGVRYDWKIVGKKEIYVPYNNYKVMSASVKYKDLLTKGHANPDYMRYELHRVWVLEANLKQGYRHQYAKRRLYLDEDSWVALAADNFDAQGQLWRTNMATMLYAYDAHTFYTGVVFYHDLASGAYLADRLSNETAMPVLNNSPQFNPGYFSPDAARSSGT